MKRILYIVLLLLFNFTLKAQYPVTQNLGSDSTIVVSKGALKSRIVLNYFTDTTEANTQRIKQYPFALIGTTGNNLIYYRNSTATRWVDFATSARLDSLSFISDSTLVICYSDGSCDTISFTNNVFVTNNSIGCTSLLQGGLVSWRGSGMIFDVTAASYNIQCRNYNSPLSAVTLSDGDATHPRLDVIAVDTNNQVVVIEGTPAADPIKPQVDPASQLELTTILIAAGATTPSNITLELIYNEDTGTPPEWNTASSNWTPTVAADFNNTANPYLGSKDILISTTGTPTATSNINFTAADTLQYSAGWNLLKLYLSLNQAMTAGQGLSFQLYFNFNPASNVVNIFPGTYTFSGTTTGSYQPLVIPWGAFIPLDTAFNQLYIRPINGTKGFYVDYIQLQSGLDDSALVSSGRFIENQFSYSQPANWWIGGTAKVEGRIQSTDVNYLGSERWGLNASATGVYATSLGAHAAATAEGAVVLGSQSNGQGIVIGYGKSSSSRSNVTVGGTTTGTGNSLLGIDGTITGNDNVKIGESGTVTGNRNVNIGYNITHSFSNTISLGYQGTPTASNQLFISSNINRFTFYGVSRGVAGYVMTDSTGTGEYWVARPASGVNTDSLFARADSRNNSGAGMAFSSADQDMFWDSVANFSMSQRSFLIYDLDGGNNRINVNSLNSDLLSPTNDNYVRVANDQIQLSLGTTSDSLVISNIPYNPSGRLVALQIDTLTNRVYRKTATAGLDSANNGLSESGTIVQLGQSVGASGNPAILLSHREIPMGGFTLSLNASASQSAKIFQTKNVNGEIRASINGDSASFTNTGGWQQSEIFGNLAYVRGINAVAVGNQAGAGSESVVIGRFANDTLSVGSNVLIGKSALITSSLGGHTVVGNNAQSTGSGGSNVVVGTQATTNSSQVTNIGYGSVVNAQAATGVGQQVTIASGYNYSIALGAFSKPTAANQMTIGGSLNGGSIGVYHYFLGGGVVKESGSTIEDIDIQPTGALGTDQAGVNFYINGAKRTGNSTTGGVIIFQTSTAGASGTTLQSLAPKIQINGSGIVAYGGVMPTSGSGGTDSAIYRNSSTGQFYLAPAGAGSGLTTADNGLTANTATNVRWGGTLIQNTSVDLDSYTLQLAGDNGVGLYIDPTAITQSLHDAGGTGIYIAGLPAVIELNLNGSTFLSVDDDVKLYQLGDIDAGTGNETVFIVNDASQNFTFKNGGNTLITVSNAALTTFGTAGTIRGSIALTGNTSGTVTIQPDAAAGTYTLTLPTNDGDASQVLTTDGSGVLSWTTVATGSTTWNGITNPTADQALSFDAGESSTWTDANTTEDLFTVNNSTATTNSLFSLNRTSTALAAGNNIMELVSSGANGTATITSTTLRISNTNTGTTSTNVGLNVIASGATNNYAMLAQGYVGISTPSVGAFSPTSSIHIKDANTGVTSFQIEDAGSSQVRFKIREYGGYIESYNSVMQVYNSFSSGRLNLGGGNVGDQLALFGTYINANTRLNTKQGADVASANNLTLGTGGNSFEITGTTQINLIDNTNWQNGSVIRLLFTSTPTVKNAQATSGTNITILLAGGADFVATANDVLILMLGEIGGTQSWFEIGRSVN